MLKKIFIFLFVGCAVMACSESDPASGAKAVAVSSKDSGAKIFKRYCISCHGSNGKLNLNGAKDLTASTLSLEERILMIEKGKGMMTPFKGMLTEKEIRQVAAYTFKLNK